MRKLYRCFFTQNNLLILLFGLFAVVCFGQNKQAVECKEKEYFCKIINYSERINSVCKANDIDCHIAEYAKIVESNPNDPAAYFIRGTAYRNHFYKIKDPDRTILDFKKILELDPQYRSVYFMLTDEYISKKEYDQAIVVISKAIEINPQDTSAYLRLGTVYSEKGEHDQAIKLANKAIELARPDDKSDAYAGRGNVYSKQRDFVIELSPRHSTLYSERAAIYVSMQKFDKAVSDYNKAIEIYPRNWYSYYVRGYFYWMQGEKAKAEADCQKVIELARFQVFKKPPCYF